MILLELFMVGSGIYSLITGKTLSIIYNRAHNISINALWSRILGLIFLVPIPASMLFAVIIKSVFGEGFDIYSGIFEVVAAFLCLLLGTNLAIRNGSIPATASEEIIE